MTDICIYKDNTPYKSTDTFELTFKNGNGYAYEQYNYQRIGTNKEYGKYAYITATSEDF